MRTSDHSPTISAHETLVEISSDLTREASGDQLGA